MDGKTIKKTILDESQFPYDFPLKNNHFGTLRTKIEKSQEFNTNRVGAVLNGPGLESPPLVGTGVGWPPPGPLGSGSLKIQVWASHDSLTFFLSKVTISATFA